MNGRCSFRTVRNDELIDVRIFTLALASRPSSRTSRLFRNLLRATLRLFLCFRKNERPRRVERAPGRAFNALFSRPEWQPLAEPPRIVAGRVAKVHQRRAQTSKRFTFSPRQREAAEQARS